MTQMDELRQAVDSISRHTGPMLSAYLSVNAAIPENRERAYLVRLKDAMDEQGVPEELQLKVREYVEENVDLGAPEARSWSVWKARESGPRKSARKSPWTRSGRAVSGARRDRIRLAGREPRLPARHAVGAGGRDPLVRQRRARHNRHNAGGMPLLQPADPRPATDRSPHRPGRRPRSPSRISPRRERAHRHSARRVRRAGGPHSLLTAKSQAQR